MTLCRCGVGNMKDIQDIQNIQRIVLSGAQTEDTEVGQAIRLVLATQMFIIQELHQSTQTIRIVHVGRFMRSAPSIFQVRSVRGAKGIQCIRALNNEQCYVPGRC